MLYVQFDASTGLALRAPELCTLKVRKLGHVFDCFDLRGAEPALFVLRLAVAFVLGRRALSTKTWAERGLDVERGFALVLGRREPDGRWPVAFSAWAHDAAALRAWLASKGVSARSGAGGEGQLTAGHLQLHERAEQALGAEFRSTLASDDPYLELGAPLGHGRTLGELWIANSRRGNRFQAEMVLQLPGLSPLHMLARDPPEHASEMPQQQLLTLGQRHAPTPAPGAPSPPSWDEPGPCDCGIPADECTMKRFRLTPAGGAAPSALPGADSLRQLTAALIDLHQVRSSEVPGILAGDRVLVARSPESLAAAVPGDAVLDSRGAVALHSPATRGAAPVLQVLPWPRRLSAHPLRDTFSGLW